MIKIYLKIQELFFSKKWRIKKAQDLIVPKTEEDTKCCFYIQLHMLRVLSKKHNCTLPDHYSNQARTVLYLLLSKAENIANLLKGKNLRYGNKKSHNNTDPTSLAVIVRNIIETVSLFHLIYIRNTTKPTSYLVYNLWVHSGLKYRQRMSSVVSSPSNVQKLAEEQLEMVAIENDIKSGATYNNLPQREQGKIDTSLTGGEYKVLIENNRAKKLSWQQVIEEVGFKPTIHNQLYNYLSFYAHPTNVSVFQFDQLIQNTKDLNRMTMFNLKLTNWLLAAFISDYTNLFGDAKKYFSDEDKLSQTVIDSYNKITRGQNYSINNMWQYLDS